MGRTDTPMTRNQWKAQLKKFNVPFREVHTFKDRNSGRDDETGLRFGPVAGVIIHHTGSDGSDKANRDLIVRGRSDLPGPLATCGLNDDGVIDLITTGRANHAGAGDRMVLGAVVNQSYGSYPPKPQRARETVDGNDYFYGLEAYYFKNLTKKAYASMVGFAAAICDFHGWNADSVIGHKEWTSRKVDPNKIDMKDFRKDVQAALAKGAKKIDRKITVLKSAPKYKVSNKKGAPTFNAAGKPRVYKSGKKKGQPKVHSYGFTFTGTHSYVIDGVSFRRRGGVGTLLRASDLDMVKPNNKRK